MNFYNENNKKAAAWLRQLIADGHIPAGVVDERSICEIKASDLVGYTQHHFFCGIGGWSHALRLACVPDNFPVVTGSCPCQPFSCAGQQKGFDDERHLWPVWFELIRGAKKLGIESFQCVVGEQVERAVKLGWLDGVRADMEGENYAFGFSVLGAHSAGAPNIRQRLYWMAFAGAVRNWPMQSRRGRSGFTDDSEFSRSAGKTECGLPNSNSHEFRRESSAGEQSLREQNDGNLQRVSDANGEQAHATNARGLHAESCGCGGASALGIPDTSCGRCGEQRGENQSRDFGHADSGEPGGRVAQRLGDSHGPRSQGFVERRNGARERSAGSPGMGSAIFRGGDGIGQGDGFWDQYDIIKFKDGKARRIEPGTFPLVNGFPCRVDLLRGFGNAINPWTAAIFIETAFEAASETQESECPILTK